MYILLVSSFFLTEMFFPLNLEIPNPNSSPHNSYPTEAAVTAAHCNKALT